MPVEVSAVLYWTDRIDQLKLSKVSCIVLFGCFITSTSAFLWICSVYAVVYNNEYWFGDEESEIINIYVFFILNFFLEKVMYDTLV